MNSASAPNSKLSPVPEESSCWRPTTSNSYRKQLPILSRYGVAFQKLNDLDNVPVTELVDRVAFRGEAARRHASWRRAIAGTLPRIFNLQMGSRTFV